MSTTKDDAGDQVDFVFKVVQGPQARIGNVAIEGTDVGFTPEDFRKKAKLNCGIFGRTFSHDCRPKVTRDTTSAGLANLRKQYQKMDRLEATVSVQKETYEKSRQQLDYDFAANQGPVVKVVVLGAKVSKSKMHLLMPVFEEGAVDNDLLNEGRTTSAIISSSRATSTRPTRWKLSVEDAQCDGAVHGGQGHEAQGAGGEYQGQQVLRHGHLQERLSVKKADLYVRTGRLQPGAGEGRYGLDPGAVSRERI